MMKKIISIFATAIFLGCIIVLINPNFTYIGLLNRIGNFPNFIPSLSDVSLQNVFQIPVPNLAGFSSIVRGLNRIIEYLYLIVEYDLMLIRHLFDYVIAIMNLLKYIFLGY